MAQSGEDRPGAGKPRTHDHSPPEPSDGARRGFKTFQAIWGLFPVRTQQQIDDAVTFLRSFVDNPADPWEHALYWRAQAWLSYACLVAFFDKWDHRGKDANGRYIWGDQIASLNPSKLRKYGVDLAREAANNHTSLMRYDFLWARAYAELYNSDWSLAQGHYLDAINALSDPDITAIDYGLYTEAADGYVYLGEVAQARNWINTALASGQAKDWYNWVDGWVHLAEGILKSGAAAKLIEFDKAIDAIELLPKRQPSVPGDPATLPVDFDASIITLSALALSAEELRNLNNSGEADRRMAQAIVLRDAFLQAVDAEKGHGVLWSVAQEMRRSPFSNGTDAQTIATAFEGSLLDVFGA